MAETTPTEGTSSLLSTANAVEELLSRSTPSEDKVETEESQTEAEEEAEVAEAEPETDEDIEEETLEASEEEAEGEDDEAEDVDEEAEVLSEETLYRVKTGDEEVDVSLDELKNSYMRTSDYTRKTQQVAEQRKAAEAELDHLQGERKRFTDQLEVLEQALSQAEPPQKYWDSLQQKNPVEYLKQKENLRERKDALAQIQLEKQNIQQQQQQELQVKMQEHIANEQEKLLDIIPEWRDEKLAQQEKSAVITYAQRQGYSEEELAQASDARAISLLRKAMMYDNAIKQKPAAKKKVAKAPRMTRSGTSQKTKSVSTRRRQKAADRFHKSGSMDDAVNLLLERRS